MSNVGILYAYISVYMHVSTNESTNDLWYGYQDHSPFLQNECPDHGVLKFCPLVLYMTWLSSCWVRNGACV